MKLNKIFILSIFSSALLVAGCQKNTKHQIAEGKLIVVTDLKKIEPRLSEISAITHPRSLNAKCENIEIYFKTYIDASEIAVDKDLPEIGLSREMLLKQAEGLASKFLGAKPNIDRLTKDYDKKFKSFDFKTLVADSKSNRSTQQVISNLQTSNKPQLIVLLGSNASTGSPETKARFVKEYSTYFDGTQTIFITSIDQKEFDKGLCELLQPQLQSAKSAGKNNKLTLPTITLIDIEQLASIGGTTQFPGAEATKAAEAAKAVEAAKAEAAKAEAAAKAKKIAKVTNTEPAKVADVAATRPVQTPVSPSRVPAVTCGGVEECAGRLAIPSEFQSTRK